jgi:tRNA(Ile)-lysidine synthase
MILIMCPFVVDVAVISPTNGSRQNGQTAQLFLRCRRQRGFCRSLDALVTQWPALPMSATDWKIAIPDRFGPCERYLVGVSGGRDSVALLDMLLKTGYKNLVVCHLNHGLRGRASDADARFVERLAAKHRLVAEIGSANVRRLSQAKKLSLETAAREARYSFFAKTAKRTGCGTILLAHHADDLVETFLLNLFRGAGASGLAGMREVTRHQIGNLDLSVVRPLLGVWRDDIDKYVKKNHLEFREDASNKDLAPRRNRIRRRIIPYLEKTMGRKIRRNIWKTATIFAEEENFFETLLPQELTTLAVKPLREMSVALQRRVLHKWLRGANVSGVGFDLVERVRQLLDAASRVAKTNLPKGRHVRRRAGKLFME